MNKVLIILIPFLLAFSLIGSSQVINGYAKVSNVSGTVLTLNNVDEVNASFEDGERVIIMQMQDNVIGSIGNNATFGSLGAILSAGVFEIATISTHTEALGLPNSITVSSALLNAFNTGANSSLQIITYPTLGSPDYVTTSNMSAKAWDGNTGGVLAFAVNGVLTLAHNIEVDGDGFKGAGVNGGGSLPCTGASNYRLSSTINHADKGGSIYKSTNINFAAGRARILSGGGGGNSHNAGGGGGSNFSAGGEGGPGWPNCNPAAGGFGGLDLSIHIGASRVFMGGGGGAGEGNNGNSQGAGNGAGIILIKADEIRTNGACGGLSITANGESVILQSFNDGSSAGGAAGSIILEVPVWNISGTCPVTIQANGGNGGNVLSASTHGGGAGGGMGVLIFSSVVPIANVTLNTLPGNGGVNCTSCGTAGDGLGNDGDGVIDLSSGPLPIELLSFEAIANKNKVDLKWVTISEINNSYFTVYRSLDALNWEEVLVAPGAGNSKQLLVYENFDFQPKKGLSYYRLKQTDFDGNFKYFNIVPVRFKSDIDAISSISLFPNPMSSGESVRLKLNNITESNLLVVVRDGRGREVYSKTIVNAKNGEVVNLSIGLNTPKGIYLVTVFSEADSYNEKLIVR